MKTNRNSLVAIVLAFCALLFGAVGAFAQSTNFPDPTIIYSGLVTPFNTALGWVIGAIAVLTLIGWIMRAVSKRK